MRRETEGHFLVGIVILGCLTIYKKSQTSSTFEALNSVCHSRFQKDVRPPVEMRGRLGLSVWALQGFRNPFICDMNDEPSLSLCRVFQASFVSGQLGVHFT